jgi:hypothetical protein
VSSTKKRIFALIAVAFFAWGGLNTTGFCFSEMRYVPDKEFFARYLESTVFYVHPQLYQVEDWTNDPDIKSFTEYRDGNDFLAKNPDCCSYGPQQGVSPESDLSRPTIFQRFFGLFACRRVNFVISPLSWRSGESVTRNFLRLLRTA